MSDPTQTINDTLDNMTPEAIADTEASTEPLTPPTDSAGEPLAERLAAAERERDEYLDQWRRSAAEFQNFRRREERLRVERERNANQRLLRKLLPVLDDLRRGAQHVPADIANTEWVNGMLAIERKLWSALEQENVAIIPADPGTAFDPAVHEALVSQEAEGIESGHIVQEIERGYRHGETVLRPARVSVAK